MENFIYNTLAYIIVLLAIFTAVKKLLHKSNKKVETTCATGCGGCNSKCDLKELVKKPEINR